MDLILLQDNTSSANDKIHALEEQVWIPTKPKISGSSTDPMVQEYE